MTRTDPVCSPRCVQPASPLGRQTQPVGPRQGRRGLPVALAQCRLQACTGWQHRQAGLKPLRFSSTADNSTAASLCRFKISDFLFPAGNTWEQHFIIHLDRFVLVRTSNCSYFRKGRGIQSDCGHIHELWLSRHPSTAYVFCFLNRSKLLSLFAFWRGTPQGS